MNNSMILIKVAQSDVQDRDLEDNMRITGFSRHKDKNSYLRLPLNIQVTQSGHGSGKFLSHSLRKRNLSSLDKLEKSQMKS